jgi:hypothetical protein
MGYKDWPNKQGLIFSCGAIAVGAVLGYFLIFPQVAGIIRARNWVETSCTIKTSKAERVDKNKYATSVRYFDYALAYEFKANGRTVVGDRRSFAEEQVGPSSRFEEIAGRYPAGSTQTCYYDPSNPRDAVLDRGFNSTMWIGAIPGTFLVLGLVFLVGNLMVGRVGAYSDMLAPGGVGRLGYYVGGALVLVGVTLSYFLIAKPVTGMFAARNWTAVPCVITGSTVTQRGSGTYRRRTNGSYDWVVNYQYEAGGRTIIRDRVSFWPQLQGRQSAQQARAARYPKGSTHTCYYNPANPDEAVLDRGVTFGAWMVLVALAALGIGVAAIAGTRERLANS